MPELTATFTVDTPKDGDTVILSFPVAGTCSLVGAVISVSIVNNSFANPKTWKGAATVDAQHNWSLVAMLTEDFVPAAVLAASITAIPPGTFGVIGDLKVVNT